VCVSPTPLAPPGSLRRSGGPCAARPKEAAAPQAARHALPQRPLLLPRGLGVRAAGPPPTARILRPLEGRASGAANREGERRRAGPARPLALPPSQSAGKTQRMTSARRTLPLSLAPPFRALIGCASQSPVIRLVGGGGAGLGAESARGTRGG